LKAPRVFRPSLRLRNDARAAGPYHPSMDGEGFVLFGRAAYLTSTTVFADGGIMQWSVAL